MSALTDFVVLPDADLTRLAAARSPAAELGGVHLKGIDPVKVAQLHAILTGRPIRDVFAAYDPVVSVSEEGPWIFRLPVELVNRLAAVGTEESEGAVARWAASEEVVLDRMTPDQMAEAFRALMTLAQRAESAGQSVFLWLSV